MREEEETNKMRREKEEGGSANWECLPSGQMGAAAGAMLRDVGVVCTLPAYNTHSMEPQ